MSFEPPLPDKWNVPIEAGWSPFPVRQNSKIPIESWVQYQDSPPPVETVAAWNERFPDCNVGIATGRISGMIVLDLDSPEAVAEAEKLGIPHTVTAKTGNGMHVFFRYPGVRTPNRAGFRPHMDIRGDGGYVVGAGSMHESGSLYEWIKSPADTSLAEAPDWVLASRKVKPAIRSSSAMEKALKAVANAGPGTRNDQLNKSAFELAQLAAGGQLDWDEAARKLAAAATVCGLEEHEIASTIDSARKAGLTSPKGAKPEPISQNDVALEFANRAEGNWLFDHSTGHWLVWDDQRYVVDQTGRVRDELRKIAVELGDGRPQSSSWSFMKGAEGFARNFVGIAVTSAVLDQNPFILATPGGTVDLQTGGLRPAEQTDRVTLLSGTTPQVGVPTLWLKFLGDALVGDAETISLLQRWCGYCLTGDTREQALLLLYGGGGNGKSVFINILSYILGEYAKVAAMDTFTATRMERHSTELAMLCGARLVSASETEAGKEWDEVRVKAVTGSEPITARLMRQDNFTFHPNFKLLVATNHQPRLRDCGDAMRRRLRIVPFTVKPLTPDLQLEEKLKAEAGQIMHWMIEGCLLWQADGLGGSAKVEAATAEYFDEQDTFTQWLAEECVVDFNRKGSSTAMFDSWSGFAMGRGEQPGNRMDFACRMRAKGFVSHHSNGTKWGGVDLRRLVENAMAA